MNGVVVLDDFFPRFETGFRIAEFTWLLDRGIVDRVLTTQPLEPILPAYSAAHPDAGAQVEQYTRERLEGATLAVLVFLNNALYFLPDLEATGTPFVVTLYPGGGLNLGDPDVERNLRRVLLSPLLRAVVTTQPRVTAKVREIAPSVDLTEIIGVVVNPVYHSPGAGLRGGYFGVDKDVLDLCFAAHKYEPTGRDKGYDVFLDVLRELQDRLPVRGHVIGGFTGDETAIDDIHDRLSFYGTLATDRFRATMLGMDAVIAPSRPGISAPFAFDGFPTGAAVEGALSGAAIIATDPFAQNVVFRDGRDVVIVPPDAREIAQRILDIVAAPGGIRRVARGGLEVTRAAYGVDAQLWTRRRVIERIVTELSPSGGIDSTAADRPLSPP